MDHSDENRQSQIRGWKRQIEYHTNMIEVLEGQIEHAEQEQRVSDAWKQRTEADRVCDTNEPEQKEGRLRYFGYVPYSRSR